MSTTEQTTFLTVRELATYLRVSRTKAYQLVASGEVPAVRVGGQFRIPRALLAQSLAETLRRTP